MANIFDQFDGTEHTPVAPAGPTEPGGHFQPANPFDQFDAPKAPTAPVKEDILGQAGAGLVTGLPNAVTGTLDMVINPFTATELGKNDEKPDLDADARFGAFMAEKYGEPDPNKPNGYTWDQRREGWQQFEASGNAGERKKATPTVGEYMKQGLTALHLNPEDYFRPPATPGERIARLGGEGAVTALLSPNKAQGWAKLMQIFKEMGIGTASGLGAGFAMEAAPDEYKPLAGLAGGFAGGIGSIPLVEAPGALARSVKKAGDYVAPAIAGKKGIEKMAGAQLADVVGDRDATIAALGDAGELVEGSKPTAFQATGNVGIGSLERALARSDDEFKRTLIERVAQQNEARVAALDAIQETGNPAQVADFFRGRMQELEGLADELYTAAETKAKGAYEGLGDRPAGEIGEQARSAIEGEFKRLNTEASRLWESIDPDGSLSVKTGPLVNNTARIYGAMSPEEMLSLSAAEKDIAAIIGGYGDTLPFKRFKALRSEITAAMRDAKMTGKNTAYGRLSQLRSAVEDAVSDSIAGKMEADPSLAENFVRKAREWYEDRVTREAGAGAPASAVGAATGDARVVPAGAGAAGSQVGVAPATESPAGLSPDAVARRAVEGGGRFDQGDVINLGERRERKELEGFHRNLMGQVGEKVALMREATRAAREKGIFEGFNVGDRLRSQNMDGKPLSPMKIEGVHLRAWEGDAAQMRPFERLGIKPTIVEFEGQRYVPMVRVAQGDAPPANLTSKQIDEWVAAHPDQDWSRFDTYLDLVRDRGMRGPQKLEQGANTLFQSGTIGEPGIENARPFYSAALKSVVDSKTNKASPQQWAATIKNTPGVKQEELDWLGLTPWLAQQKGAVTKEQVADFIRANQIEVEETNLAGGGAERVDNIRFDFEPQEPDADFVREMARERAVDEADDLREQVSRDEGIEPEEVTDEQIEQKAFESEMAAREAEPDWYASVSLDAPDGGQIVYDISRSNDGYTYINTDRGESVGKDGYLDDQDIREAIYDHYTGLGADDGDGPTQYGEYTLPGGKDYHELLLKLPERKELDNLRPSAAAQAKYKDQWDDVVRRLNATKDINETQGLMAELDALSAKMIAETKAEQAPWRGGENFDAPHYEDQSQNILAHVRFKERQSVDGKKTLFLEEVQSDWHQQGRDKGYQSDNAGKEAELARLKAAADEANEAVEKARAAIAGIDRMGELRRERNDAGMRNDTARWQAATDEIARLQLAEDAIKDGPLGAAARGADLVYRNFQREIDSGVPDAPFKTTWPELALKRMIRWAADNGYDQIAWTPGSVQNKRYGLSQHVDEIEWQPMSEAARELRRTSGDAAAEAARVVSLRTSRRGNIYLFTDAEGRVISAPSMKEAFGKPLSEVIGKDISQQIMADADGRISKQGLAELGGSGMREFYDRVLVSLGNKLGKKFGTQVGKSQIRVRGQRGDEYLDVPALPITPEMREGALRGQPLFQKANEAATSPENTLREPSAAQKEAGNYRKGHVRMGGLDLSIENPAGSQRKGTDSSGKPWTVDLKDHYGYIKGTVGRDKDHLDVFVSRNAGEIGNDSPVFVVNQIDPKTGRFDEHKAMLGYPNKAAAEAAYKANYAKDWKGMGSIIPASLGEFKQWLADGDTKKPFKRSTPYAEPAADVGTGSLRQVQGEPAPAAGNAGREADGSLRGLPRKVGNLTASAYPAAQQVAASYMKKAGLEYRPPNTYAKVDPERASRIAEAYDAMEHAPGDPAVQRAYKAMADETLAQYQAMLDDGMKIEFIAPGQPDPYAGNPRNMTEDVRNNKHMWVFATRDGFGSDATFDVSDNPLLGESGFEISGQPATINDIFRAVHDYFGHVKEGVGFRADGEENAWRAHSAMYSPEARRAMTSETRGQNSWVNYGPYGETNRTARSEDTHYADQKIGLLPEWVAQEGAGDDTIATTMAQRFQRAGRPEREAQAAGQLVDAFYATTAQRLGKSVDEVVDQFPLPRVKKEGASGGLKQDPRGQILLGQGKSPSLISLFEKADASTALHEAGHQFLHMFRQVAGGVDAPEALKKDWQAVSAWWDKNAAAVAKDAGEGVTAADVRSLARGQWTGDAKKDAAIDRGLHEQWARAFEVYLREGKAPNPAMRGVFEQFKDWLTQVYRSVTGMGVNLSPDIKGVFDRMLGGEGGEGVNLIDEAAAKRFNAATAATRNIKDTFGAKPVKPILRRPGPTYPYEMSPEKVADNLFRPGPEGAANIQNVMKAGAPRDAIEAAAVLSAKRSASKDGALDPTKFEAWRSKHADALRALPGLDRRFSDAASATKAMVETGERNAKAIDSVRRSAVGKLLDVEASADVSAKIGSMLNRQDAVKSMRRLAVDAGKDPNAMEGLRRAVVDHMLSRLKTPKDALRADTFQRYIGRNAPALAEVLTPEQMAGLRAIAQDLKRASKDVRAPGGGSDTVENLAGRSKYVHDKPTILGTLLRQGLGGIATGVITHSFFGPLAGAASWIAQTLGGTVLQSLRQAGISRIDDLIKQAVLDPELMRALLMKAPKVKDRGSAITLRQRLENIAAMNLALSAAGRDHGEEARPVERRRVTEYAASPMGGIRG